MFGFGSQKIQILLLPLRCLNELKVIYYRDILKIFFIQVVEYSINRNASFYFSELPDRYKVPQLPVHLVTSGTKVKCGRLLRSL